ALLPNGNYFQILTVPANGPPVLGPPRGFVLGGPCGAVQLKPDREFDIRLAVISRGEKVNRTGEGVFPFRPAFHVITRVLSDELLRDRAVIEIANWKSEILHLRSDIRTLGIAQIILDEFVDAFRREVLFGGRRFGG